MWNLLVFVWGGLSLAQAENQTESKVVKISQGLVRGYIETEFDVFAFYEIPYATVIERYKAPGAPPTWNDTFEAVERGIICPQLSSDPTQTIITQEDCLVANVFVPNTEETNLPVLVNVHGGGYQEGSGSATSFKVLGKEHKIITVRFNYRVGALGFLCLGTKDAPGNAGLKDQLALLRWVKQNIDSFGGNPDDITLSGCSAGSASVDILTLSNTTKGLFNRAISDSGAHLGSFSVQVNPTQNAKDAAKMLNFQNVEDIAALELFYKNASVDLLTSNSFMTKTKVYFAPCVEKDLGEEAILLEAPYDILKKGEYVRYPTVYGFTDMEGMLHLFLFDFWKDQMNENFLDFVPADLHFKDEDQRKEVAKSIKEFYFGDQPVSEATILSYVNYFTDVVFAYGMMRSVKMHAEAGNSTFYLHEYSFFDNNTVSIPFTNVTGADHCAQVMAVQDEDESSFTDEYRNMKKLMRGIWANFIKTGVPVLENSTLPTWPPSNADRSPHLSLGKTVELKGTPIEERTRFWDDIYEKYYHAPIPPSTDSASTMTNVYFIYFLIISFILS